MKRDRLPLFAWQPPRQVLLFPLSKRVGKTRRTAQILSSKHGEDASLYWKQVVSAARKHLLRVGLTEEEIEEQLSEFFDAVQAELVRLAYSGRINDARGER